MALEPIGSMMSIQAQTMTNVKPVEKTEKPASEYTDVAAQETAKMADPAVSIVEAAEEKGNAANGQDWGRQKRTSAKRASVHVLVHERRGIDHNSPQKIVCTGQFGNANRREEDLRFGFGEVPRVRWLVGTPMRISEWQMHGDVPVRKIQRRKMNEEIRLYG